VRGAGAPGGVAQLHRPLNTASGARLSARRVGISLRVAEIDKNFNFNNGLGG
jgi:hypothetical protein